MGQRGIAAAIVALIGVGLAGLAGLASTARGGERYEEPTYEVVAETAGYQLRQYSGWIEARVTVASSYQGSVQQGFQVLAGYIFGGNQSRQAIDMTTPVAAVRSETIEMTTPVSASGAGDRWTVSFMMPSKWTMDTLPVPKDPRIDLVEVAPSVCAVRTFSGRASKQQADAQLDVLRHEIEAAGLIVTGPPSIAQFDPPWVLGPWRRNEVRLPVRAVDTDA